MKKLLVQLMLVALSISMLFIGVACTRNTTPTTYPYPSGGMMGPGGWMGPGGMMGSPRGTYRTGQVRLTIDQALQIAKDFLTKQTNPDLQITEIMEFDYNFYIDIAEKSSGIHAFEALIDPFTGDMYAEPGPNMMWNTRYGMMSGVIWGLPGSQTQLSISENEAGKLAQDFIDSYVPGGKVNAPERFYGYYTLDFDLNGKVYGMLSVNGYTGQVWYHSWHGAFRQEKTVSGG